MSDEIVKWWIKDVVNSWIGWPLQIITPKNTVVCENIIHIQFLKRGMEYCSPNTNI